MKTIILTGGGTAGHVMPNIALIPKLKENGFEIHYIGTADGIEKKLISELSDVTYHEISSGKLRRYFSLKNLSDPFKVLKGIVQSKRIIKSVKPDAVFSKGGFVSVPVVIAASKKVPVVAHESDYTPGLANKIGAKFCDKICVSFEDTLKYVGKKGVYTGSPVRGELLMGDAEAGRRFLGFDSKPVITVMGGSLGAAALNDAVRKSLPMLLKSYNVLHICGAGKVDESIAYDGYVQREFISAELKDVFKCTSLMVSRAGANAIFEFLALKLPSILVPLPIYASRGDQILNAKYFEEKGYSVTLDQDSITPGLLTDTIEKLYSERAEYVKRMSEDEGSDGTQKVFEVIISSIK